MKRIILALTVCVMFSGCASIVRGPNQQVHLNAYDAKTNQAVPTDCFLCNAKGITYSKSNKSTIVGRDSPMTMKSTPCFLLPSAQAAKIEFGAEIDVMTRADLCSIIPSWNDNGLSGKPFRTVMK